LYPLIYYKLTLSLIKLKILTINKMDNTKNSIKNPNLLFVIVIIIYENFTSRKFYKSV